MKIALISTYFDIEANGLRALSSILREAGHQTSMIFLPRTEDGVQAEYPEAVVADVVELCKDAELVGTTLMSNNFSTASHLTQHIRKAHDAPIVWGGIHPTVRPEEESLEQADMICVGEGDEAFPELVATLESGGDVRQVENIWTKDGDTIRKNPSRPVLQDLDGLPFADYSLDQHFIIERGRVVPMEHEHLERRLLYKYTTSTSRGCILNCSFCCHNAFRKLYGAQAGNTRRRSVDNVMRELEAMRAHMPYVRYLVIDDDSFMDASLDYIEDFSENYARRVGLPFMVTGFIPVTVTDDKVRALAGAGLYGVRMGIQSGVQATKRLYRRNIKDSVILRAANIFAKYPESITTTNYDLILDNPWEHHEDGLATIELLRQLPRPFIITFYSLTFYPGTDLYTKAREEGLVTDDERDIYRKDYLKLKPTYMNGLTYIFGAYDVPDWIAWFLIHPKVVAARPDFMFPVLYFIGWPLYQVVRALRHLRRGDTMRVKRWVRLLGQRLTLRAA